MEIIKCKNCGYELFPNETICSKCGMPVNPKAKQQPDAPMNQREPIANIKTNTESEQVKREIHEVVLVREKPKGGESGLGIAAILCSVFCCFPVGLILAIIDLATNKDNSHILSIISIVISCILMIAAFFALFI